jgi:hypothetical protein
MFRIEVSIGSSSLVDPPFFLFTENPTKRQQHIGDRKKGDERGERRRKRRMDGKIGFYTL